MDAVGEQVDAYGMRMGAALRTMREEAGVTQEELANKLGVRQAYVSRWEKGEPALKLDTVEEIEQILGRPKGYLLRLAGYVMDGKSTLEAIAADPRLGDDGPRQNVILAYQDAVKRTSKNRGRHRNG